MEKWKDIEGLECRYRISNKGRVLSLPKKIKTNVFNKAITTTTRPQRLLSGRLDKDGYVIVDLSDGHLLRKLKVHRLVAEAFLPKDDCRTFVNHKNGVKNDNRVENLEWCTDSENKYHAHHIIRNGKPYYQQKSIVRIDLKSNEAKEYNSITEASIDMKISKQAICMCLRGKTKLSCGYQWQYKKANLLKMA